MDEKKIKLTSELLTFIFMCHRANALFKAEANMVQFGMISLDRSYLSAKGSRCNLPERMSNYFNSVDDTYLESLGLKKDDECLFAVLNYKITEEIRSLFNKHEELSEFSFIF
jgi:hypothetical protein